MPLLRPWPTGRRPHRRECGLRLDGGGTAVTLQSGQENEVRVRVQFGPEWKFQRVVVF